MDVFPIVRKNKFGGKLNCLYNNNMKFILIHAIILMFSSVAIAAKTENHWLKVESEEKKQEIIDPATYPYDSLEPQLMNKKFTEIGFWSLQPKLIFSGGFHGDKAFFETQKDNRWFFNSEIKFFNKPWHRWSGGVLFLQNNSLFLHGAWEYTPSRKPTRSYYGIGAAHRLISEKEFRNFLEGENYYLTLNTGFEFLARSQNAWNIELKGFLSSDNYVAQLSIGYMISL